MQGLVTRAEMFRLLTKNLDEHRNPPFDFVVVDEAQDISVAQLRFLAALWAVIDRTTSFSRAIWDNGFSKRRFPGKHWVSTSGGDPGP